MDLAGINEISVESTGDDVTYRLPVRPMGMLRLAGLIPFGFTVAWLSVLAATLGPQFRHLTNHPQPFDYFICAFLLCFVVVGCLPAGFGLLVLCGRCRVRWSGGRLLVSEQVGPLGWPRRMPQQPIVRFVVMGGGPVPGGRPLPGAFGKLAALTAKYENGVSRTVATGYPRPWLEAIAQDLSARAGLAQSTTPPPVEIYQGLTSELAADVAEKPAKSPVTLQHQDRGVMLNVPPAGLWKGSMGLMVMAIFWCLLTAAVSAAFFFDKKPDWAFVPFFGIFWLIGFGLLATAINLGRRWVALTAGPSELVVVRSGLFGTKRFEFRRADIASVTAGSSNVEMNHRPVPELQVRLTNGTKTGFLVGRDATELRWIATELRTALGLDATDQATPGFSGYPFGNAGTPQAGTLLGKILSFVVLAVFAVVFFWRPLSSIFISGKTHSAAHSIYSPRPAPANPFRLNKPVAGDATLVFNSFGPAKTSMPTNTWAVGREAHAEWFIPTMSGTLSEIELAVDPNADNPKPGKATIFISPDKNGFPGRSLETFSVPADEVNGLMSLTSVKKPMLQSGVKYWLCAKSKGGWSWHLNDQNIIHSSAREIRRNKWASAGDYGRLGAFSIRISTNPPPTPTAQPTPASESPTKQ